MNTENRPVIIENISRRAFLGAMGAAGLVLVVGCGRREPAAATSSSSTPNTAPPKYGADSMPHGWVDDPMVFVLWGGYAQKKEKLIDGSKHVVLKAAHPSPLSAKKFFGSRPFSAINDALQNMGKEPIDWQLPNL